MQLKDFLPRTLVRKIRPFFRKLWVRVVIMGLMSVVALVFTQIVGHYIPQEWARSVDGESADRLLLIIANAMLAVTTFSITVMVSVRRATSSQWTPRVHRLIVQDRTTQNVLAVFIGAYVYALTAIIMRETGIFKDDSAFVLFCMTVLVLAVIVVYLVRWVLHLQSFGSLIDTAREVENTALIQFTERLENPCLGANALCEDAPDDAHVILASESGYVQHILPEALNETANDYDVDVYFLQNIGSFVFLGEPLIAVTGPQEAKDSDDLADDLRKNIIIGDVRTFDQDPRFGLIVMAEIGSKALSPGINDPGTAIDVITRMGRILSAYKDETASSPDISLDRLYVSPLDPGDLLEDCFAALSRDGALMVEVQQHLQKVLSGLMEHPDKGIRSAAKDRAIIELRRAREKMRFEPDAERVAGAAHTDVREAVDQ
ncbi:DUF2254 domain-containing protein [Sulfitobacter sp. S190]|uniref:DUF2254 domain-containing protein n=1 Tax=Sulfitobacter sp. S190 TaxID=2867022 RepID=UPI0021A7E7E5|nr:DUF2254 domain-containing protein [Sulfitobacter sp. S190]UWR20907.1 DUF2254 domain-containing protein [Sulfitobacter sp. S190]